MITTQKINKIPGLKSAYMGPLPHCVVVGATTKLFSIFS